MDTVKYSIKKMRNPSRPNDPQRYYAQAQMVDSVDQYKIASEIGYSTSLTEGDVLNVIRTLCSHIKRHLANGAIVVLEEFGSFQYQISSEGADTFDEFTDANIKKARVLFRPGKYMRSDLANLKYEYVIPLKAKQQAIKDEKARLRG